ncbi:hypothetical protein BU16DRAFT_185227 [Lophium mytilinum]|uniref:Uncharacterized protein n=1 Tax=Lophium mytilinum TaxID=390894 RepID=A0A6A6QC26_9PEZI|nr:hypothetical protein BU16DRAFT_185227 [Lophium mytilinum]
MPLAVSIATFFAFSRLIRDDTPTKLCRHHTSRYHQASEPTADCHSDCQLGPVRTASARRLPPSSVCQNCICDAPLHLAAGVAHPRTESLSRKPRVAHLAPRAIRRLTSACSLILAMIQSFSRVLLLATDGRPFGGRCICTRFCSISVCLPLQVSSGQVFSGHAIHAREASIGPQPSESRSLPVMIIERSPEVANVNISNTSPPLEEAFPRRGSS